MKKRYLRRFTLAVAFVMTGFFGFPGLVAADVGVIDTTGPGSYNKIEFGDEFKCDVENNNNVGVGNVNVQNAQTGDASVGGSDWHKYDPAVWKARGASYQEWYAAASAYMNSYDWNKHGGGGNTTGGDATSGDATNVNDTRTNVSIDNSGACGEVVLIDTNGDGKPDKKVDKKSGKVLGAVTKADLAKAGGAGGGHVLGANNLGGAGGQGGASGFNPTTSGGKGGGPSGGNGSQDDDCGCGGDVGVIDTTGPNSYNKIEFKDSSSTYVNNNNNVSVVNVSKQKASTGDASVSGNTTGGNAGSGSAGNGNDTGTNAGIDN